MSNAGQGILAIAGGVIGFYLGGPTGAAYGFQLGLAVGTVVSPTQLPGTFGPRLTDNRTTTSQIGAPVPLVFGIDAVAGEVMWIGDIIEHENTQTQGGKGAPEQDVTTYSYTQSIAIGLCAGPMAGILRIWENGKLVYDIREQQQQESDAAYSNRLVASALYRNDFSGDLPPGMVASNSGGFTLYLGDEDQLPDPTIELKEGVGNVPAFRGLMYIVYPDRVLRDDQGRRHPNFKFEIYDSGSLECHIETRYAQETLYDWAVSDIDPRDLRNDHEYNVTVVDGHDPVGPFPGGSHPSLAAALAAISAYKGMSYDVITSRIVGDGLEIAVIQGGALVSSDQGKDTCEMDANRYPTGTVVQYESLNDFNCLTMPTGYFYCEPYAGYTTTFGGAHIAFNTNAVLLCDVGTYPGYDGCLFCTQAVGDPVSVWYSQNASIRVTRKPKPVPGYTLDPTLYSVMRKFAAGDPVAYPLGPAMPMGSANDTQAFWEAAYAEYVTAGILPAGQVWGVDYPQTQAYGYSAEIEVCSATADGKAIADIVENICNRCGLFDIDVEDLRTRYVLGYQIARVTDGRSAIAPLRSVGFFDAVESGGILKYPTRGKASVRTLSIDDLGAHAFDSDTPAAVTTKEMQDVELPRQLFIQFRDPERDYETNEQPSPSRLTTDAINDVYVDVAVAISATVAKQCAEVIWADQWASRWQHTIATDASQADLEPADCFLIPIDGRNERVRAISIEDSAVILRSFQLVRDDDGQYVSEAIADASVNAPSAIAIYSTTTLKLLDLPPLRATDNDVGVYAAVKATNKGFTWGGVQLYRSLDGGATFDPIATVLAQASTGTVAGVIAEGDTTVWDETTVINLVLLSGASLESKTDDEVFAGDNTIAVGAPGRWEILQFATALQTGVTTWQISRLLRGRRGTEHLMGRSVSGDYWALVSGDGIVRLPLDNAYLNQSLIYKAVTLATSYAAGVDQNFTSAGVARLPFSPVSIAGERDSSGDILITWIRRDRLGDELPDGDSIAMTDPPETYEVDIYNDDSPPTIVRTLSSSTTSVTYTAAQQATDFGMEPDQLTVLIYQISAVVGRGTGQAEILEFA